MPGETEGDRPSGTRLCPAHHAGAVNQSQKLHKDPGAAGAEELVAQGPTAAGTALPRETPGAAGRLVRHRPRHAGHAAHQRLEAALRQRVLHVHGVVQLLCVVIRLIHFGVR